MEISAGQIRGYRLRAHHLDKAYPMHRLVAAAGACGLQNSPPGAWETALYNRLQGCALPALHTALYTEKTLLQAWSYRGVPLVFPAAESGVFLAALVAQPGEWPWIYTRGITAALDHLGLPFDDLLARTMQAARYLDSHTVQSKEALDRTLADIIRPGLPKDRQALWQDPSMYGRPDRQTVGGAAVSFLLRPCAFHGLVVFGRRQGISPTFTSYKNWAGGPPAPCPDAEKELVRRFLRCYGPATADAFMNWLGCSPAQARRLWQSAADEMAPVRVAGKPRWALAAELGALTAAEDGGRRLLLLGAHDPYLDLRDRAVILENKARHPAVWQTVANPGEVLKGGRVVGTWKARAQKDSLDVAAEVWEGLAAREEKQLEALAGAHAAFRGQKLRGFVLKTV